MKKFILVLILVFSLSPIFGQRNGFFGTIRIGPTTMTENNLSGQKISLKGTSSNSEIKFYGYRHQGFDTYKGLIYDKEYDRSASIKLNHYTFRNPNGKKSLYWRKLDAWNGTPKSIAIADLVISNDLGIWGGDNEGNTFFEIKGNIKLNTTRGNIELNSGDGHILMNGSVFRPSDRNLKNSISNVSTLLPNLLLLEPKIYKYNDNSERKQYGFIAQEVKDIFPLIVDEIDEEGTLGINYEALVPILVKAVQEQEMKITSLENKLDLLLIQMEK